MDKITSNTYYQIAQRALAYPNSQVLIVGSSRGEMIPVSFVEKLSHKPTLNMSVAGADLSTKIAFINFAKTHAPINTIIWQADFFELINKIQDIKIRNTPSLRHLIQGNNHSFDLDQWSLYLQSLIDSNTINASLYNLKKRKILSQPSSKTSLDAQYEASCQDSNFVGKETVEGLKNKLNIDYYNYTTQVINTRQDQKTIQRFYAFIHELLKENLHIVLLIPPYHPEFLARLQREFPEIYKQHQDWIRTILQWKNPHLEVLNFFPGLNNNESLTKSWNDGVHFSCFSAVDMLKNSKILMDRAL
ncbi:MAG: hypothetical protein H6623_01105 [Bdellovibrionaceae bacterium]|nr:hypothetical protein [Pseudobdellovibrionaceae bacterium]